MTKQDLLDNLAQETRIPAAEAAIVVSMVFSTLASALSNGDRIEIRSFGVFSVREYDGYQGRNPRTAEVVKVQPKRLPFFKPGKELKQRVDRVRRYLKWDYS
jgi:integration host factor subunit beta